MDIQNIKEFKITQDREHGCCWNRSICIVDNDGKIHTDVTKGMVLETTTEHAYWICAAMNAKLKEEKQTPPGNIVRPLANDPDGC